jgi:predicted DNA binding CopG/RHH family protein
MYKKISFEEDKVLAARHRLTEARKKKKRPTSIALDEETIQKLKMLAEVKGIPYQVLMRSYILKGIHEEKEAV